MKVEKHSIEEAQVLRIAVEAGVITEEERARIEAHLGRKLDPHCGCGLWICPDCRPENFREAN